MALCNADTCIANHKQQLVLFFALLDCENHLTLFGKLDGVAEKVDQDLTQTCHVAVDAARHIVVHNVGDVEALFDGATRRQIERGFDALTQVEGLELDIHPACLDLTKVKDIVDDREQGISRIADGLGVVTLFFAEIGIHQESTHPDDGIHRSADLVTHGCQEGALCLVGSFGRGTGLLGFVEKAYILDRDHRLICKDLQDGNLFVCKRLKLTFTDANTADRFSFSQHRDK